jgi:hypothetical protein
MPTHVAVPRKLSLPGPLPMEIVPGLKESPIPALEFSHLKLFMMAVQVKSDALRKLASAMGDLKKIDEGVELVPREISPQQFSNWLQGRDQCPPWRVAQLAILCEWTGLVREADAEALPPKGQARVRQALKGAARQAQWFWSREELRPWMLLFRKAVLEWLKQDKNQSLRQKKFYELYAKICEGE